MKKLTAFITATALATAIGSSLVSCASRINQPSVQNDGGGDQQDGPKGLQLVAKLRPSFYWVALETNDGQVKNQKLLDPDGNVLATVSMNYLKKLNMEGTGRLLDGRVVNFKLRIVHPDGTKEIRWRVCDPAIAPYGYGVDEIPLVPFRSTAVDPSVIPIGSKVYIPAAVGAVLPDGTVHDGMFTAVDIGDLIQNKKIDIFTAFGDQSKPFDDIGFTTGKMSEVYLMK